MNRFCAGKSTVQQGFVLAAVLWLLVGLSLVVALMGDSALSMAYRVSLLRERAEFVRTAVTARASLQYWIVRSRATAVTYADGANQLLVNDVPYLLPDGSQVSLQDHAGLMQLNAVNRQQMVRFLGLCGVSVEKADSLVDALEDYVDDDDLSRVNGAERDAYSLAGLPAPRNAPLLSAAELWRVMGWASHMSELQRQGCDRQLSMYAATGGLGRPSVNPSTAPSRVQRAIGMDEALVQQMQELRLQIDELERLALLANEGLGGRNLFGVSSAGQAGRYLHVRHASPSRRFNWDYTIEVLPDNSSQPWVVLQPSFDAQGVSVSISSLTSTLTWPLFDPKPAPAPAPANANIRLSF